MQPKSRLVGSLVVCFSVALGGGQAGAGESDYDVKPLLDYRLRYEGVDQAGMVREAQALTSRLRAGFEIGPFGNTRLLMEAEWVEALIERYNSTTNGKTLYPIVADPEGAELNRLQLTNTSLPQMTITLGRQRIALDDQRFIGNVGFRQNEQTYDAVRIVNGSLADVALEAGYIWKVQRVFGNESPVGQFEGNSLYGRAAIETAAGRLVAFAYLFDFDNSPANASKTFGVRLSGVRELGTVKLSYAAALARQSDYGGNPLDYDESYFLFEGEAAHAGFFARAGLEMLGGNGSKGFSTPLATLHKFQGYADIFLNTPSNGIEDRYAALGYRVGDLGAVAALDLQVTYHRFEAEKTGADYGSEWDAEAFLTLRDLKGVKFSVKCADYEAKGFAQDTRKFWVGFEFSL